MSINKIGAKDASFACSAADNLLLADLHFWRAPMRLPAPTRRVVLICAAALWSKTAVAGSDLLHDPELSAAEIVERMGSLYARCATYQDSGLVTISFLQDGKPTHVQTLPFSTAFVRPSQFRFEFSLHPGGRFLAVANAANTRTWWDVQPGVEDEGSLELALAKATGISGGAAHTVPALLMPDSIHGARLTALIELKRLEDAKLDEGIDCFRVEGINALDRDPERQERVRQEILRITGKDLGTVSAGPQTLWIEKSTFLLHRIDHRKVHSGFNTNSTTRYLPVVNIAIAESQLAFDPPTR